jgi:hypothetical protein
LSGDDPVGNLTAPQVTAVRVLVATGQLKDAAEAAGCSDRTVRRWLAQPTFAAAYRFVARAAAREAVSALLAAQRAAVATLRDSLIAESDAVRVRAARALLEVGARALDDDFEERVSDLEREVSRWQQTQTEALLSTLD